MISRFANPGRFLRLAGKVMPVLAVASIGLIGVGLWLALVASPPDYQQGESVRIMYVHVPAAWCGMALYVAMAVAAAVGIVARHLLADLFCVAAAPVGAVFTALCLVTGSIWGRPTWGAWWAWDARLTSVLILFLLYLGFIALRQAFEDEERGARAGFILLLVGAVNIPVVRFSVDWWQTLHQSSSVMRLDGPTMPGSMLWPLLIMAAGFTCLAGWLVMARMRTGIVEKRVAGVERRDG